MKGSLWKRAAGIGLVLALSAGLCACGRKNENASLAKEGVYSVKEFKLPELDYDYYNVMTSAYRNGRVYLLINAENWREEYWSGTILLSMNDDGTDVQTSAFEEPDFVPGSGEAIMPGTAPEGIDEPDAAQDPNDKIKPQEPPADPEDAPEVEEPEDVPEAAEPAVEEPIGDLIGDEDYIYPPFEGDRPYTWENSYYNNYSFGSDGKLYAIRTYDYQYEDYENPENSVYTQKYFLSCWNGDGSFLRDTEMEGFRSEDEWYYIEGMSVSENGTVNLLLDGDSVCMVTVDAQGNCSGKEPLPEEASELLENSFSAYPKDDGSFLLMYNVYSEDYSNTKVYLSSYNPATHVMEELGEVPTSVSMNGYGMRPGVSSDFVYRTNLGIYTYNVGDDDSQMKMSFINSDLNISDVYAVIELNEESFICIYSENYENGMLAGIFTHVNPEDIPDKSVLVLAGNGIGSDLKQRVVEFNRSSENYRIVVKDYSMYASYDDYMAGITQLNNDIISGKMPDIMIANDNLPTEIYASKGWLADIGKLIQEDEELSQVEFLENVFNAYSMNDKLIYVVPRFNVVTMIGKKSIVGDGTSWTMEDAMKLIDSMPEGTTLLGADTTRSDFFNTMMRFCGSDFIDLAAGKCDFNSQNFIKMMEYAKSLPEEFEYDDEFWMNWDYYSQYRENKVLLMNLYISSFENISYNVNGIMGGDVSYIGFPTESGKGSYLSANERYAISSKSNFIDGAWEFLRYYLTDEYQNEITWNLPVQKEHFLELAQEATRKPHYTDENGEEVEYDYTTWMGGEEIIIDPLSQEQLDELLAFIYTVDTAYSTDDEIMNIVSEDIEAYFSGQKSAEEVAAVIQNRAQLYLDVNR